MFIGHLGVGLAAKRVYPPPSVGTYVATAKPVSLQLCNEPARRSRM